MSPAPSRGIERAAPLFSALSDPTRLLLVDRLSHDGPQSISSLAETATVSRQAVTKHLLALEETGLATSRREGRERIFELQPQRLVAAHRYLDRIARQWDEALDRLRVYVEDQPEPRRSRPT
jgi:DNA-binding transcriptional ArsR family regulator